MSETTSTVSVASDTSTMTSTISTILTTSTNSIPSTTSVPSTTPVPSTASTSSTTTTAIKRDGFMNFEGCSAVQTWKDFFLGRQTIYDTCYAPVVLEENDDTRTYTIGGMVGFDGKKCTTAMSAEKKECIPRTTFCAKDFDDSYFFSSIDCMKASGYLTHGYTQFDRSGKIMKRVDKKSELS